MFVFTPLLTILLFFLYGRENQKNDDKSLQKATLIFAYFSLIELILFIVFISAGILNFSIKLQKEFSSHFFNLLIIYVIYFLFLIFVFTIPVQFLKTYRNPTDKIKKYLIVNSGVYLSLFILFVIGLILKVKSNKRRSLLLHESNTSIRLASAY